MSRQTADDVEHYFGVPPNKVRVIHNGVAPEFAPGPRWAQEQFRAAQGLPARYLLYLGTLEPRKNLEMLVRAFGRWRTLAPEAAADVKLVLAGGKGWYYDTIFTEVSSLGVDRRGALPRLCTAGRTA